MAKIEIGSGPSGNSCMFRPRFKSTAAMAVGMKSRSVFRSNAPPTNSSSCFGNLKNFQLYFLITTHSAFSHQHIYYPPVHINGQEDAEEEDMDNNDDLAGDAIESDDKEEQVPAEWPPKTSKFIA